MGGDITAQTTGRRQRVLLAAGAAAVAASPVAVAGVALIGDSWVPMSDWASLLHRVSQVGGRDTPLVGPYSFHGFAHPGPLLYWVTAPVHRLTGGDPRSLLWTGALVNIVVVAALAAVAWRRGRWPLLLATMLLVALVVHGLGPEATADLWNPYVALLPFLLTVFLAWDAALGRRDAVVAAVVPASFAMQAHLAFVSLTLVVALWLVGWVRVGSRIVPGRSPPSDHGDGDGGTGDEDGGRELPWTTLLRRALVLGGILWAAPLLDALFDLHNPVNIAKAVLTPEDTVGLAGAPALVGDHVGLTGPWLTGGERELYLSPPAPLQALHVLVLLMALAGCLHVARRRRLVDVAALVTLAALLLVAAVPAASQLVTPTPSYLTAWFKVVGGLGWFAVGWTAWRVAEADVRSGDRHAGLRVAGAVAGVTLVGVTAWSWPQASRWSPPNDRAAPAVQSVRAALRRNLARDRTYRVEVVGDSAVHFSGFVHWMVQDGFEVVTEDGGKGLKWGHDHRWSPGEPYDAAVTVVVSAPWTSGPYDQCRDDPRFRQVAAYDALTPWERARLVRFTWRRLADEPLTAAQRRHTADLTQRDLRIGVFEGARFCGRR